MRILFTELRSPLNGFRKLLLGSADLHLNLCRVLLDFQKSYKGDAKSHVESRNTEIGNRFSHLSTDNSQQLFAGSGISPCRSSTGWSNSGLGFCSGKTSNAAVHTDRLRSIKGLPCQLVSARPAQQASQKSELETVSTTCDSGWVRSPQAGRCCQRKVSVALIERSDSTVAHGCAPTRYRRWY